MDRPPDATIDGAETLVSLLRRSAAENPAAELFSFLPDGEPTGALAMTRGDLDRVVRELAARLQSRGLAGERALLVYPPGLDFLVAFFGCLYAGVVAVPAYPPRPNRPMTRLISIVEDARPAVVLTCDLLQNESVRWSGGIPELSGVEVLVSDESGPAGTGWKDPGASAETLAFLQYTSGSTAAPRGVMISHGNLMDNSRRIQAIFGSRAGERGVFWLPLFHDMGLIGGVIQTLYCGGSSTLMSPVSFLQRPLRWLEAISRTGATISGAPNFAYDLCVEKSTHEQRAALDLSQWKVAFNGAEPVRAETLERFAEAFEPAGFRAEAFLPCYGLAEATLLVSGHPSGQRPVILSLDAAALGRGLASDPGEDATIARLVSSGRPAEGHLVAIVDPAAGIERSEDQIGEIWVSGPSVAQGYWGRPEESGRTMGASLHGREGATFLRTGDLGFLRGGEVFVAGRIKDLIILHGRNIYPQDVEWAAERSHPALRAAGASAFAVEIHGEERLAVVAEIERRLPSGASAEIFGAIRRAVAEAVDVEVSAIRIIRPATLPRTSSGKVQRHLCREAFLAGSLETLAEWNLPAPGTKVATKGPVVEATEDRPAASGRSRREIAAWLADRVARSLGIRPDEIDPRAPLSGFGIGSMQAVRLASELEEWLGRKVAPTLVYDYPTILAIAGHLSGGILDARGAAAVQTLDPGKREREPIAIVGIGCRFPGARGPVAFWNLLCDGVEAIGEVPDARWTPDDLDGLDFPARSGFLQGIDLFDASFFEITRREATFLDPQQRMLLEVTWEALEDAGQPPDRLAGAPVGVFIGISTSDYAFIQMSRGGDPIGHRITGGSASIAANRISHFLDLRGPSLAIDTACSSSLVATLTACRSLWEGESEMALAGGANVLLQPQVFEGFARGGFLSPDGRCRAFDAGANGYVRGEGVGVVVLKPLSRALADGDRIYALIRGGAVNQDGRTIGLTAPSGPAQQSVLRAAYREAGIEPGQVDYIEAHGTGTPLGDPIELASLGSVLGEGRAAGGRCALGSVKTNIGHLEAAAGIAGLIKTALALHHQTIPASLHYTRPNPHVDFDALPLQVVERTQPWPSKSGPARAGVSAFGFGGTNAHLVLEEAPSPPFEPPWKPNSPDSADLAIPISARTPEALADLARSLGDFLRQAHEAIDLRDVAFTAGARRAHLEHRLAIVAADRDEAIGALSAFLRGEPHPSVMTGRRRFGPGNGPVLVFPDQVAIPPAEALASFRDDPAFRATIERVEAVLPDPAAPDAQRFAIQLAMAALWESWGIVPGFWMGEGLGALAASVASRRITLDEAARILDGQAKRPESMDIADELARAAAQDPEAILAIGTRPGLASVIRSACVQAGVAPVVVESLRVGDRGLQSLSWAVAALHAGGLDLEWSRLPTAGRFVRLPSYPWQHQRYWFDQETPLPRSSDIGSTAPLDLAPVEPATTHPSLLDYLREKVGGLLGLSLNEVDLDRSLMAMGMDSIFAMELKLDLDAHLGAKLPLSILIEGSSIREIAERAGQYLAEETEEPMGEVREGTPPTAGPQLSHGQRMLWSALKLSPTGAAYHIAGAGLIQTAVDIEGLRRALLRAIDRHEALRCIFPADSEGPSLRLLDAEDLAALETNWFRIEDASALDLDAIPARLTELVHIPIELESGPLFRVHLLNRADSRRIVLLVFHHIISDFLSAAVFLDDLARAYMEEIGGPASDWPSPIPFGEFVRWQESQFQGETGDRLWSYWRRQLEGPLPVLDLPTDFPRPAVRGERARTFHDELDPDLTAALIALAEVHGASLYTTLLAALQAFLARWSGQDEVIVGTPVSGRTRPGLEGSFGYFVNMLPMRADLRGGPTFAEFLARVRRTVAEALEHQDFPFALMFERLRIPSDPSRTPIFQAMYAHQRSHRLDERGLAPFALGVGGARLDLHGLPVQSIALDRGTTQFELNLLSVRDGDRLRLAWEYRSDLYAERTIESMAEGFRALLAAIIFEPDRPIGLLPMLDEDERRLVLDGWGEGRMPDDDGEDLVALLDQVSPC